MYGFLSFNLHRSVSEFFINMTMFPAHLSSSKYVNGGFSDGVYDCFISIGRGFSDLMAEDDSRTAKDDDHGTWLQLSLGGGGHTDSTTTTGRHRHQPPTVETNQTIPPSAPSVDLNLSTGGLGPVHEQPPPPPLPLPLPPPQLVFQVPEFQGHVPMTSTNLFLQPTAAMNSVPFMTLQQHHQQQQQQETNYNFLHFIRPFPTTTAPASSSSSFSGSSEQYGRQIHVHRRLNVARVINPPRRPHSGVWFMLQASQNQAKEPFLPQIPKSYLRIRDGRMTVGLLIKYLVNKLELESESEVEITCKGHQLLSLSTLQHVRDTIWNNNNDHHHVAGFSVVPQSSATISHLMVLNYGRIA